MGKPRRTVETYHLIDKTLLLHGYQSPTDIYELDKDEKTVTFLYQKYHTFNDDDMQYMQTCRPLYIALEGREDFDEYCIAHIDKFAGNSHMTFATRSNLVLKKAESIMDDMFENPESLGNVKESQQLVDDMVEVIVQEDFAVKSMMEIASHDYYTHTHSINVSIYALSLGKHLNMSSKELKNLGISALLHDLGKSKIDKAIINKNGALTPQEFETMKKHPVYGYEIAKKLKISNAMVLAGLRNHHEKLNGGGYPDGQKGVQIAKFARIIAVCDIFDALTTKRSYKDPVSTFDTLKLMKEQMKEEIDMNIVNEFILMMKRDQNVA